MTRKQLADIESATSGGQWRHSFAGGLLRILLMFSGLAGVVLISFVLFAVMRLVYHGESSPLFQVIRNLITGGGCFATLFLISHRGICEIIGWILAAIPLIGYPVVVIQSLRARHKQ
jgi:hypothetical protein